VRQPDILLFDECTNGLDNESERILQESISSIMACRKHTTITISHKMATVRGADRIVVVVDGIIREIGSHVELLSNQTSHYRRFSLLQAVQSATGDVASSWPTGLAPNQHSNIPGKSATVATADISTSDRPFESDGSSCEDELCREKSNVTRVWELAIQDKATIVFACVGAVINGLVFPAWGVSLRYRVRSARYSVLSIFSLLLRSTANWRVPR